MTALLQEAAAVRIREVDQIIRCPLCKSIIDLDPMDPRIPIHYAARIPMDDCVLSGLEIVRPETHR